MELIDDLYELIIKRVQPQSYLTGTVTDEDDLVAVTLQKVLPTDLTGPVTLSTPAGGARVKVWESSTKGVEVTLPKAYNTPGDLPKTLYVEGVAASDEQRDVELKLECTQAGTTCSDKVKITVVSVDLSATALDGAVTEQNEEDPGAYVHYNIDNDNGNTQNGNPIADRDEDGPVTDENDLKQASISLQPSLQVGTVVLRRSNINARVWKTSTKGAANKVLVDGNQKTWDLSNQAERNDFNNVKDSLWVEGFWDYGTSSLTVEYKDPDNNPISSDMVKYTFIGAVCGRQPTPSERNEFHTSFPNLVGCEWSITAEGTDTYNCIAWSVGINDRWFDPVIYKGGQYVEECWEDGVHYASIDKKYGDKDNVYEISDLDAFYSDEAGYTPTGSGPSDAQAMYYDGYHAAKRKECSCGAGKWIMFESKCGNAERIEHDYDQLDGSSVGYGSRSRYYK